MKLLKMLTLGAVLLAAPALTADDPKPAGKPAEPTLEEKNAAARGDAVGELGKAAGLAEFGREVKSPEALALAGGMLLRADKMFGGKSEKLDVKPAGKDGKPLPDEKIAPVPLKEQADALFTEARGMVSKDPAQAKALEALIKRAEAFEGEKRGSVGGPRTVTRTLNPGETHTYTIGFVSGQPAAVSMTSTGPAKILFDITHAKGTNLLSVRGLNANYSWVPVRDRDNVRVHTITLQNLGARVTTYTLTTN